MSATISLIGIIIAVVFVCYSVYRGLGLPLASIISGVFIWVTSGINIQEGWTSAINQCAPIMGRMAPIFIFGSILGMFYAESGAAASLGLALFTPFKNVGNPTTKRIGTLFMFFLLRVLLGLSGIDNMAVMVTMVALVTVLFQELDMPRRYCNCVLMVAGTIATFLPSVPSMLNVILPDFLPGFTANSLVVPRALFCLIFIAGSVFWLNAMVSRDLARGEHFELGGGMSTGNLTDPDAKRPFWVVTLIPILVIFVLYNFVKLEAWSSLAVGTVVAGVLFIPYIKAEENKNKFGYMVGKINKAAITVPLYYNLTYITANAILISSGYALLTEWMKSLAGAMPLPLGFGIVSTLLVPIGSAALLINAEIANTIFVPAGLSAATAGTLLIVANTVFDSLPNNPGMIMQSDLTATPMKECYPAIFKTTVLLTGAIMVLAVIMAAIGII